MRKKNLQGLYLITDESLIDQNRYFEIIESLLELRPSILQLRIKTDSFEEILYKSKQIKILTDRHKVTFILNDYVDVAVECGADGVHIGEDDIDFQEARNKLGPNKVIGVSCYGSLERCEKFVKLGADYLAIGTPYYTKTKPNRKATSFASMKEIVSKIKNVPIFAIGGIDSNNIQDVLDTGVSGVAVITSVFGAKNPIISFKELDDVLKNRV